MGRMNLETILQDIKLGTLALKAYCWVLRLVVGFGLRCLAESQ